MKEIMILYCPLLCISLCANMVCQKQTWWEIAVEYAITMGSLVIKHPMVEEKSFKILLKKNPL